MKIIKNIMVAFSLYSQIPMPKFQWQEEDMKHNLVILPWIGAVIGALSMGVAYLTAYIELPLLCRVALYGGIPLLVTGGFHLDGYLDVQDALKSYQATEKKLEILKDPHIGAFAVIRLWLLGLVWGAALSLIWEQNNSICRQVYFLLFFVARAMAAAVSLKLKPAKKSGMLQLETAKSSSADFYLCLLEAALGLGMIGLLHWMVAGCLLGVAVIHFVYYRNLCEKQFGGITGDTAGFYITTLEEWFLVMLAILSFFIP